MKLSWDIFPSKITCVLVIIRHNLISNVETAVALVETRYARRLQHVSLQVTAADFRRLIELYLQQLAKSTRIVVPDRLGVAQSLKQISRVANDGLDALDLLIAALSC